MKTGTFDSCVRDHRAALAAWCCVVFILLGAAAARALPPLGEVLRNQGFTNDLSDWVVNEKLAGWSPLQSDGGTPPNKFLSLHPTGMDFYGFTGVLVYQNLNVTGVASSPVSFAVQLRKLYAPAGSTLAFYVDYITTAGAVKRQLLLNPANDAITDTFATYSVSASLPSDAAKIIRLVVAKNGSGEFQADDFSLRVSGPVISPVPVVTSVFPPLGPYYAASNNAQVVIRGTNLGTNGTILLGTSPVEDVGVSVPVPSAQIVSWNNTQIVARIVEPQRSGSLKVLAENVEAAGSFAFTVTSPTFTVDVATPSLTAIRGEVVTLLLRVNFLNGFQSANGVSFFLPELAGVSTTADQPLKASGGYSFQINTATLTNGDYRFLVQSLEGSSYARFASFTLKVVTITNIAFTTGYPATPISSLSASTQGEVYFGYQIMDHTGAIYPPQTGMGPPPTPPLSITTSDPNVVLAYNGGMYWQFFAVQNGAASLTFSLPGGFSASLPVNVNLTGSYVTNFSVSPAPVDNSGLYSNILVYAQGAETPSGSGYLGSGPFDFDRTQVDWDDHQAWWYLNVKAGTAPGTYAIYKGFGFSGVNRYYLLTVLNASTHGMIQGNRKAIQSTGSYGHQEIYGAFELYNLAGQIVLTNDIFNMSETYQVGYITPGSYKVRFVPFGSMVELRPQWYPNSARNFAEAATLTIAAGQVVTNINFLLSLAPVPQPNQSVPPPVVSQGRFDFTVSTVPDVVYYLEYKDSLSDPQWTVAAVITGDGATRALADAAATSPQRFYRLRMQGQ